MLLRIILRVLCIGTLCLIVSCAAKGTIKKEPAVETDMSPAPIQDVKPVEPTSEPLALAQQQPPEIKRVEPIRIEADAEEKYVILNFDDADIHTVISAIGSMLNINYVLAPGVTGKVTIQSHKKFLIKDIFQIFQTILEVNGLTAVKDGALYRVVPIDTAKQQPLDITPGKELKLQLDSSFITQIVPLEYVKASDVSNMLRNLMPRGADLIVYEPTNLLIVTAPPASLVKFMKIIEAIDIPSVERESIRTFVYFVENSEAKILAELLKSLYGDKKTSLQPSHAPLKTTAVPAPYTPSTPTSKPAPPAVLESSLSADVEGDIIIVPYEDINALLIKTSPRNYLSILETLKKLDIPSKQVLIEVLIVEVSLTDNFQFGIEWMLKLPVTIDGGNIMTLSGFTSETQPGTISSSIDTTTGKVGDVITTPSSGTPFAAVIDPDRYGAILSAFASSGKLNVLSNPHILAMDNKEAKIEIGDEIPIATGFSQQPSTSTTTSTTSFVAAGQIQYRTTGVILTVTPYISENNKVKLKINQEISSRGVDVSLAGITSPSFTTRKAQTTGIVMSGHTLIIGGLISEQKNTVREGIPLLSSIPIIGYLFGVTKDEVKKTELLVMVTPHVISSQEEADALTKEFQNKVRTIKERIEDIQEGKGREEKE
ncbi:MAG: secretin N-terminal domain-containing protein [Nitrospirota bacterium]